MKKLKKAAKASSSHFFLSRIKPALGDKGGFFFRGIEVEYGGAYVMCYIGIVLKKESKPLCQHRRAYMSDW